MRDFAFSNVLFNGVKKGETMPTKSTQLKQKYYPPVNESLEQAKFPAARYFQIHFEHLESQLDETRRCLGILQQQMSDLYKHLSLSRPELIETKGEK
jgi:hypothetical protein